MSIPCYLYWLHKGLIKVYGERERRWKKKKRKKVTRQKPPGHCAKQERAALIEAVQADVMDDHMRANQGD